MRILDCTLEERAGVVDYALALRMSNFNSDAGLATEGGLVSDSSDIHWRSVLHEKVFADVCRVSRAILDKN